MAAFIKGVVFGRPDSHHQGDFARLSALEHASSPSMATVLMRGSRPVDARDSLDDYPEKEYDGPDAASEQSRERKPFRISPRIISDAIIGLSDGLTVPFALTAGLSALGNAQTVVYGGFAELIAGSISMGLGGYLGAKSEADSYYATRSQTEQDIAEKPEEVKENVSQFLASLDVPSDLAMKVTTHLYASPRLTDFILHFEHSLPEPPANRAVSCAMTIAVGYFVGGFIPLLPYLFVAKDDVKHGLLWSAIVMVCTLFVFGYVKTGVVHGWEGWSNRRKAVYGGLEMVVVGSVAAGAAMGLVYAFSSGAKDDDV